MRVKVCGITRLEDALLAEACGAHAIGFIFYEGSPRYIEPERVAEISRALSPFTMKVGVFVNGTLPVLRTVSAAAGLNAVQLHGENDELEFHEIGLPVIRAFRVREQFDFTMLEQLHTASILLDAYSEDAYGGTGLRFNWERIPQTLRSRIILAGGIGTENIEHILKEIRPAAVDLSSSLESAPGIKDAEKIKAFFNTIRSYRFRSYSHL